MTIVSTFFLLSFWDIGRIICNDSRCLFRVSLYQRHWSSCGKCIL